MTAFPKPQPRPKRRGPKREPRPNPNHPFIHYVKLQPCDGCGAMPPNEFAHVEGPLSTRTNQPLPRRNGPAYLSGIPLCDQCHRLHPDSLHNQGEAQWSERRYGRPDGAARTAHAHLARWALQNP